PSVVGITSRVEVSTARHGAADEARRLNMTADASQTGAASRCDATRASSIADERYYSGGFSSSTSSRTVRSSRNLCNLRTDGTGRQVTTGSFSLKRLARLRGLLERHVDSGFVPGMVAVLARHGDVHIEATGNLAFEGAGSKKPMAGDTICRLGS